MSVEPYIPLATALLTLLNTVLMILNRRKLHRVEKRTNGMQLQLLAEAERRGRREALIGEQEGVLPDEPRATSAQGST